MYSLHGLDALIRPDSGQVCQSLMVSSYWMPGSAQSQAACVILPKSFFGVDGLDDLTGLPGPQPERRRPPRPRA